MLHLHDALSVQRALAPGLVGGVLLMHDTLPWSVEAFPRIVDEIMTRNDALVAQGRQPYEIVGLERFYEPLAGARTRERPLVPAGGTRGRSTTNPPADGGR